MIEACHIFLASLKMNQDEDFEFVEKSDCEAAEEEILDNFNSQIYLNVIGEQLQKNHDEVEKEVFE
jgi:hypothetical protein